jgi:ATP-dependent RNA circularization protein (DNA/RNA ligase family)
MTAFFRFPHTPHLAWLGRGQPRDDKVLSQGEAAALLAGAVVVEEKVDGANLGFSTTADGVLRAQNRGGYLAPDHCHAQFKPLWGWLRPRQADLAAALWPDLMLFGEWCYAVHSVVYDRLPDWFLGFDVYDRSSGAFWDSPRRDALLGSLGLQPVPCLARGGFLLADLEGLLAGQSRVGASPLEGVLIRKESGGFTTARAKLVRPEFTQAIDVHWSRGALRRNDLAAEAASWR